MNPKDLKDAEDKLREFRAKEYRKAQQGKIILAAGSHDKCRKHKGHCQCPDCVVYIN